MFQPFGLTRHERSLIENIEEPSHRVIGNVARPSLRMKGFQDECLTTRKGPEAGIFLPAQSRIECCEGNPMRFRAVESRVACGERLLTIGFR